MAEYVKKSDVIKIMENNSHMIEVFGVKKKMIDGFAMCCDFADLKIVEIDDEEEINMKPEEALKELSYDDTAYGGECTYEVRMVAVKALKSRFQ